MSEHDEQVALMNWAAIHLSNAPELALLYAVPNGAKLPYKGKGKRRFSPEAMRLKEEGMKPGVPDVVLPVARKEFHGMYIELKYGKNKPTPEQIWWNEHLTEQGYLAVICWGWQEAAQVISDYLGYALIEVSR